MENVGWNNTNKEELMMMLIIIISEVLIFDITMGTRMDCLVVGECFLLLHFELFEIH